MASSTNATNDNWKDKSPTDPELGKVLDIIPVWFRLVVALGVPRAQAEAYRQEHPDSLMAGLHALCYWRDGRCDVAKFPPTWKFLLETVDIVCGSQVAVQLEAIVSPVQTQLVGQHDGGTKNELSRNTLRHRIVSAPQSPGRSGGNIPPQTVRPSFRNACKILIVTWLMIVLVLCLSVLVTYTVQIMEKAIIRDTFPSTSQQDMYTSHASVSSQEPLNTPSPRDESDFDAEEKEHPIDDKTDINEQPLEASQPQMESETLSTTTMTQSGIPRPSNAPPDEGNDEGTSKISLERLTWKTATRILPTLLVLRKPLNTPSPMDESEVNAEEKEHPIDDKTATPKKPTFNERKITVEVYKSNIHTVRWELVHSAEAVDVETGISAKARNYKSKSEAKEHARENLKAILLDRGIIRKDDI